jgi:DNA repair protein Rad10
MDSVGDFFKASSVLPPGKAKYEEKQNLFKKMQVLVNKKQAGNPLLSFKKFMFELKEDLREDYLIRDKASIFFLSLKYHNAKPDYIEPKLKDFYVKHNKVLLVVIDTEDTG